MHRYVQIFTTKSLMYRYYDSNVVALEQLFIKVLAWEDGLLHDYKSYRYYEKRAGPNSGISKAYGRRLRARIYTNRRYQAMIRKAHARHCTKMERDHPAELLAR